MRILMLIWIILMLGACNAARPPIGIIDVYEYVTDINLTPQQCLIPPILLMPSLGTLTTPAQPANTVIIFGKLGQEIRAVAAGEVIFSADGPRGYGRLIIIKHRYGLISTYAYNDDLLIKNGQLVQAGQKIASMGLNVNGQAALYFALRCHAKSVDPMLYLPNLIP